MEQRAVLAGREFTVAKQSDDREVGVDLVDHADIVIGHAVQRGAAADAVAQATAVDGAVGQFCCLEFKM